MDNHILAFDKLPKDVQTQLTRLQIPAADRFVFFPRPSVFYWLTIAVAVGWCIYMFSATQDYLWEYWMFWLFAGGSMLIISLALYSILKIVLSKVAKLKNGFVFTTDECIKTNGNRIEFWGLKELEGIQFREDIKTIEIWIGERVEKIKFEHLSDAVKLESLFDEWRKQSKESFLTNYAKPEFAFNKSMKYAAVLGMLIAFLALSFGVSYAAKAMNRNFDDRQSWKRTETATTIAEYEDYKQRHPQGNYVAEADRKISGIFSKLKDDYTSKTKKTADENAVKGLSEFLENVGKLPNRTIYVKINEKRELDDAVVKKMKQATGYSISTYDYSIPPTEEAFRKDILSKDLSLVFLPATRNASINFEMSDNPPPNTTVLNVDYVVKSLENFYEYNWYSNGSITTFYNPAAKFEFDLTLKSEDAKELYKTNYVSQFVKLTNTGLVDSRDAANYSFDKVYFASVSEDFSKYLSRQFGFTD
jgi:hypothetical protein